MEGNIGVGKTTFCRKLASQVSCNLVLEGFEDNPFLPMFYQNPRRYAFSVELFFMTERHKQMQEAFTSTDLFNGLVLSDYYFPKTQIFAKNNLSDEEFRLFQRLYNVLFQQFPRPDLLIYLHKSVPKLKAQINQRGRGYESDLSHEYLAQIQDAYFEYFKGITSFPILIVEVENLDFVNKKEDFKKLTDLLGREYRPGVYRISLH